MNWHVYDPYLKKPKDFVKEIPGTKIHLYSSSGWFNIYDSAKSTSVEYMLAVHRGKVDTYLEILYKLSTLHGSSYESKWKTLDPTVFRKLFWKEDKKCWRWEDPTWEGLRFSYHTPNKVIRNGRVLFHHDTEKMMWTMGGINKDTLTYTLESAYFLDICGYELGLAMKYPGKIADLEDANAVRNAFRDVHFTEGRIREREFDKRRKETLNEIEEHRKMVDTCNEGFTNVCDACADAMNELSDRFGIEVKV